MFEYVLVFHKVKVYVLLNVMLWFHVTPFSLLVFSHLTLVVAKICIMLNSK